MADQTFIKRAQSRSPLMSSNRVGRGLGSGWAFFATGLILLAVFGWTFFANPGRPAAADDPAYYTWRTEALLANDPQALLNIDGPFDMYSGGYRIATPVIAGQMRRIADVGILTPTVVLAVGLRVLIPMLLAGFAYKHRRDPLIWHAVAFGSASLLVTPPFAGYLDNVMTLLLLTAALYFIEPMRTRWRARIAFFGLLLLSGMTHPTTLVIFCVVLGAMAFVKLVYRRFDLRSVLRDDGAMLVTGFLAALATYAIWKVGIWGGSASLSEAAVPPPAGAEFFKTRLGDWITSMRPVFNGPLFLIGLIGLLAAGRRAMEDELARVGIVWLAPLAGVLGVFAGLSYPYYRFFNTTPSWVLLVGVGVYLVARFFLDISSRGGVGVIALLGLVAIAFVLAGNVRTGFEQTNWNDPAKAWVRPDERRDLDTLRASFGPAPQERPVVFITDRNDVAEEVLNYGFAKMVGNVSRYGVPGALQDRTAFYLGSLENYLAGKPTERNDYYRKLSQASLEDAESIAPELSMSPLIVVAEVFNRVGSNADLFPGAGASSADFPSGAEVVYVADGDVRGKNVTDTLLPFEPPEGIPGKLRTLLGALVLLVPGLFLVRFLLPGASLGETLAMVPVLSIALVALVTIGLLAITGSPLTSGQAWLALIISGVISGAAFLLGGFGGGLSGDENYSTVGS